ncbi:hypothetical protein AK812_SmicGene29692 [Symbiodinium microadriaticum]|uniref:Uncharacterized protein n=1 Tax=Symbiodinium microadriaticum TaxID=2951 RepID=A0A1Q9D176_SYMMI|nr:hypothetical protein AK812_SmicGene29692 [Symbiodinium microadriaticum]
MHGLEAAAAICNLGGPVHDAVHLHPENRLLAARAAQEAAQSTPTAGNLLQQPWLSFLVTLVCDKAAIVLRALLYGTLTATESVATTSSQAALHAGLQTLDAIDIPATLRKRVLTLQSAGASPQHSAAHCALLSEQGPSSLRTIVPMTPHCGAGGFIYLAARMLLDRALPRLASLPQSSSADVSFSVAVGERSTPEPRGPQHSSTSGAVSHRTGPRRPTSRAGFVRDAAKAP